MDITDIIDAQNHHIDFLYHLSWFRFTENIVENIVPVHKIPN